MQDKIKLLMESEGLSTSRFAEILAIQPSGVSHIVSGRNKPSFELLQRILKRFPHINPDWLLLDSSQMYRDNQHVNAPTPPPHEAQSSQTADSAPMLDLFVDSVVDGVTPHRLEVTAQSPEAPIPATPLTPYAPVSEVPAQPIAKTGASVERVILLYDDGSFASYDMKR